MYGPEADRGQQGNTQEDSEKQNDDSDRQRGDVLVEQGDDDESQRVDGVRNRKNRQRMQQNSKAFAIAILQGRPMRSCSLLLKTVRMSENFFYRMISMMDLSTIMESFAPLSFETYTHVCEKLRVLTIGPSDLQIIRKWPLQRLLVHKQLLLQRSAANTARLLLFNNIQDCMNVRRQQQFSDCAEGSGMRCANNSCRKCGRILEPSFYVSRKLQDLHKLGGGNDTTAQGARSQTDYGGVLEGTIDFGVTGRSSIDDLLCHRNSRSVSVSTANLRWLQVGEWSNLHMLLRKLSGLRCLSMRGCEINAWSAQLLSEEINGLLRTNGAIVAESIDVAAEELHSRLAERLQFLQNDSVSATPCGEDYQREDEQRELQQALQYLENYRQLLCIDGCNSPNAGERLNWFFELAIYATVMKFCFCDCYKDTLAKIYRLGNEILSPSVRNEHEHTKDLSIHKDWPVLNECGWAMTNDIDSKVIISKRWFEGMFLEELRLTDCALSVLAMAKISAQILPPLEHQLRVLQLRHCGLENSDAHLISQTLPNLHELRVLDLSSNSIGDEGVCSILLAIVWVNKLPSIPCENEGSAYAGEGSLENVSGLNGTVDAQGEHNHRNVNNGQASKRDNLTDDCYLQSGTDTAADGRYNKNNNKRQVYDPKGENVLDREGSISVLRRASNKHMLPSRILKNLQVIDFSGNVIACSPVVTALIKPLICNAASEKLQYINFQGNEIKERGIEELEKAARAYKAARRSFLAKGHFDGFSNDFTCKSVSYHCRQRGRPDWVNISSRSFNRVLTGECLVKPVPVCCNLLIDVRDNLCASCNCGFSGGSTSPSFNRSLSPSTNRTTSSTICSNSNNSSTTCCCSSSCFSGSGQFSRPTSSCSSRYCNTGGDGEWVGEYSTCCCCSCVVLRSYHHHQIQMGSLWKTSADCRKRFRRDQDESATGRGIRQRYGSGSTGVRRKSCHDNVRACNCCCCTCGCSCAGSTEKEGVGEGECYWSLGEAAEAATCAKDAAASFLQHLHKAITEDDSDEVGGDFKVFRMRSRETYQHCLMVEHHLLHVQKSSLALKGERNPIFVDNNDDGNDGGSYNGSCNDDCGGGDGGCGGNCGGGGICGNSRNCDDADCDDGDRGGSGVCDGGGNDGDDDETDSSYYPSDDEGSWQSGSNTDSCSSVTTERGSSVRSYNTACGSDGCCDFSDYADAGDERNSMCQSSPTNTLNIFAANYDRATGSISNKSTPPLGSHSVNSSSSASDETKGYVVDCVSTTSESDKARPMSDIFNSGDGYCVELQPGRLQQSTASSTKCGHTPVISEYESDSSRTNITKGFV